MAKAIKLPPQLLAEVCAELQPKLNELIAKKQKITLNAANIERIGVAGIQFLLSIALSARSNEIEINIIHSPDILIQAFKDTGTYPLFQQQGIMK